MFEILGCLLSCSLGLVQSRLLQISISDIEIPNMF